MCPHGGKWTRTGRCITETFSSSCKRASLSEWSALQHFSFESCLKIASSAPMPFSNFAADLTALVSGCRDGRCNT